MTQPPQIWPEVLKALPWEMDPSPNIERIYAGMARYKMRPWWTNYTYSNFIATSRAPFNPMQYVYRTAGLVRGTHPYGFLVDDLKKDDANHRYTWVGMLNGGVWRASVPGLPPDEVALGYQNGVGQPTEAAPIADLTPAPGDPLLLVCALGLSTPGDLKGGAPALDVETATGPVGKSGANQYYNRVVVNQSGESAAYRILLLPVKAAGEMPKVTYDTASGTATVQWKDQSDQLIFTPGADHRTLVKVDRGNTSLLDLH